jgi:hypothetical protein
MEGWTRERTATVAGLVTGAAGIALLWAGGVSFPVAVPPGVVILAIGAVVVAMVRRRWTLGLGALLGLFVTVGFLVSPDGWHNLTGGEGAVVSAGQAIEVIGIVSAFVAGLLGVRAEARS